jgi:translation initiation factor 1
MRSENPTVYTTESGRFCPKCGKPVTQCSCKKASRPAGSGDGVVRIQRDSKGRKGKTVTLVTGVPLEDPALRELLSELKRTCGTGGTLKEGVLEIQGDHRDTIFDELKRRGFKVKKVGG